jgi:non-specific serine/threonine protein kinase
VARAIELDPSPTLARAKALDAGAEMAHFSEYREQERAWATEALELYRQFDHRQGVAGTLIFLGVSFGEAGDWVTARPLIEDGLEIWRDLGDGDQVMWGTRTLAWANLSLGERQRARALYEDALRQARSAGNRLFESVVLGSLASLAIEDGRVEDSRVLIRHCLLIQIDLDDRVELAVGLSHAAETLAALGRAELAVQLVSAFYTLSEELGGAYPWTNRMNDRTIKQLRAALDAVAFAVAWDEGAKLPPDMAAILALEALDAFDNT